MSTEINDWVYCDTELNKSFLPEPLEEVLVIVDGHRGPSWRNTYPLVAYISESGLWLQERHPEAEPLDGVIKWKRIIY